MMPMGAEAETRRAIIFCMPIAEFEGVLAASTLREARRSVWTARPVAGTTTVATWTSWRRMGV